MNFIGEKKPEDFKLVCLTEAILKTVLSALSNLKGDNLTTNRYIY